MDHAGAVHLDTARARTVATAYRDPVFLDDLFRGLRKRKDGRWAQRCAGEVNFLRLDSGHAAADDRVIVVFTALDVEAGTLAYAGTRARPFEPATLRFCESGRLYHALGGRLGPLGLLGAPVAHALSEHLAFDERGAALAWRGATHAVPPVDFGAD